jgi:hypothetical protein
MTYYINVVNSDPRNDVRGVWPKDMLEEALTEISLIKALIEELRESQSTAKRLELIRKLKDQSTICSSMVIEEINEQLANLV